MFTITMEVHLHTMYFCKFFPPASIWEYYNITLSKMYYSSYCHTIKRLTTLSSIHDKTSTSTNITAEDS